jgi:release factor glutamine methyltransferase
MVRIHQALTWAMRACSESESPELEAQLLLAYSLNVPRSYFYAWPSRELSYGEEWVFAQLVQRKAYGEPLAYITGKKEFWSLEFEVTRDTLIPRPETELLVELTLETLRDVSRPAVADLGTGCGAIACALARQKRSWRVYATDRMPKALEVARRNAVRLNLSRVTFSEGSWCEALPPKLKFDAIVSNPPYIGREDKTVSPWVVKSEPHEALFSDHCGYDDIYKIIQTAKFHLKSGGHLLLEHGNKQAKIIRELLQLAGYTQIRLYQDLAGRDRVTVARHFVRIAR